MAAIIRIANLSKTYKITNTLKQDVLKGINGEFDRGELVAILGESGSGKTTLINILGGMDTDYTGSVVIKGKFIRDFTESEMDDYRKKRVGLIFQNYNLIGHMNILENICIAMEMSDIAVEVRRERALDLLKLVGLSEQADKMPNQLSGGQKQRVAIARALANNPQIILADEPTGALDKESTEQILAILKQIALSGKLVFVVTHSSLVADNCTRIVRIEDGVVTSDIKRQDKLKEFAPYEEIKPKNISKKNLFKLSLKNIHNKLGRNILVSVGMSIGITAIVLILCLSSGLTDYVKDIYGSNTESLSITAVAVSNVTSRDLETITEYEGTATCIESISVSNAAYSYDTTESSINRISCYYDDFTPDLLHGSFVETNGYIYINEAFALEIANGSIISCINSTVSLTVNSVTKDFTIGGIYDDEWVVSDKPNAIISDSDVKSFYSSSSLSSRYNTLYVIVQDITYLESVEDKLIDLNYSTYTYDDSSSTVLEYIDLGTKVLMAISAISMIVSAIMIIIVLYISIVERTQEIGILRSVGARRKDIRRMFSYETLILGCAGGVIGCVLSLLIASITNLVCYISLDSYFISYNPLYYIMGILVCIFVSVLAGVAPSIKAAELDPIEALRYE